MLVAGTIRSVPMDPELLSITCRLYNTAPDRLTPLSGGHYNAVYEFPLPEGCSHSRTGEGCRSGILRIGVEDCSPNQTQAMLEWVEYLAKNGAPVAAPLRSVQSNLLETVDLGAQRYTITAFEKAEGTLAETVPPCDWNDELFSSIGAAVGKFHRISKAYQPRHPAFARQHWFESYEITSAQQRLAGSTDPARLKLAGLIEKLHHLPVFPDAYGMIHDDLHFANFLVMPNGQVTIVDFDDCGYGWFSMDIAMALFDVLVLYNSMDESDCRAFASGFLSNYLSGYRQEFELSTYWQAQIPLFLKLKELCIYADLIGHLDSNRPGTWVGNFMRGRARRIADNLPYVDIPFGEF